eukprot:scaffold2714_cov123-Isochrysis_galbana.AAC.8
MRAASGLGPPAVIRPLFPPRRAASCPTRVRCRVSGSLGNASLESMSAKSLGAEAPLRLAWRTGGAELDGSAAAAEACASHELSSA